MMKKNILFLLIISFLSVFIISPNDGVDVWAAKGSKAKTLRELRSELAAWKAEAAENDRKQTATKNEISSAKNSVTNKQNEIIRNQGTITNAINESARLEGEIKNGKTQLETLVKTYQLARGDNDYLEYVLAADSYEDLIYRYAIIEQVMDYQDGKINEWKNKIEKNTQLKANLEKREVQLNNQIEGLAKDIQNLGNKLEGYMDISMDIKDEIASTQELINYYEKLGCKEDENLDECVRVRGDTGFLRPLSKGRTTSYFGYRTHPVTGKKGTFHSGIDIGGNAEGTNVYSAANGMVGKIIKKASCGGNQVYIYHNIRGVYYTTAYLHLLNVSVKVGDKVTNQTVIGHVGGGKGTPWDRCSTGAHLHLGLGTGWYGSTYTAYSKWVANLKNPKDPFKLPDMGKYFYTR